MARAPYLAAAGAVTALGLASALAVHWGLQEPPRRPDRPEVPPEAIAAAAAASALVATAATGSSTATATATATPTPTATPTATPPPPDDHDDAASAAAAPRFEELAPKLARCWDAAGGQGAGGDRPPAPTLVVGLQPAGGTWRVADVSLDGPAATDEALSCVTAELRGATFELPGRGERTVVRWTPRR